MSSQNNQHIDGLASVQFRILKFAYSTATHGARVPWEYADARIDYILTLQDKVPVESRDGTYEKQVFLMITGGQTIFDDINLVDLSRFARDRHPSSPLPPVTIQVACEKSIRVAIRYPQGQIHNQEQCIDRRFQVWIHTERDLLQLLRVFEQLCLPITYVDNRAALLGGNASVATSRPSTNVNSTIERISLPPRPTSTTTLSNHASPVPYHPAIRPLSSGTFKVPARPYSSSSEIQRPSSSSTLSAFSRAGIAEPGFSSSPAPQAFYHTSQSLMLAGQRPTSAFAIMGSHQQQPSSGQKSNDLAQKNDAVNQNTSSIYLSQMQKIASYMFPLTTFQAIVANLEKPASTPVPRSIWDHAPSQTPQFHPHPLNEPSSVYISSHTHPSSKSGFVAESHPSSEIPGNSFNSNRASSPSYLPAHRPATVPTIPTIMENDIENQSSWIPPRRTLPFPKPKEKRKNQTDLPAQLSLSPKAVVEGSIVTTDKVTQPITTPPENPIEKPRKRVAQRKATTKQPHGTLPTEISKPSRASQAPQPEEISTLAAKSAEARSSNPTSGLQSKTTVSTKRMIAATQSEGSSSLQARSLAARSNPNTALQPKEAPPPKRASSTMPKQRSSAAKRLKMIEQGTQTMENINTVQNQEDSLRVPSPPAHFLHDMESAFMKYKSRPAPREIHETSSYSEMDANEREKLLENWFCDNLENEDFVALTKDIANSWLSIGLGDN